MVSSETIDDVRFVCSELLRFLELTPTETSEALREHPEDFFATVPSARGGHLFVGHVAYSRFSTMARRELAAISPIQRDDYSINALAASLRVSFTSIFLAEGAEVTEDSVDRMVVSAIDRSREKHVTMTYHVPCVLTAESQPAAFFIGPVKFEPQASFVAEKAAQFDRYRERVAAEKSPNLTEPEPIEEVIVNKTKEFYGQFSWVASVSVPSCEYSVSRGRAMNAIDAALDVLRLFMPEPFAARLSRGHNGIVKRSALITSDSSGEIDIATFYSSDGAPQWLGQILLEYGAFLGRVGKWLDVHVNTGEISPLHRRYLDALHWYGQAISDDTDAGRILKLTAVLERLTIAKEHKSRIATVVVKRAALLAEGEGGKDYGQTKRALHELYLWRSRLIHGAESPYERELRNVAAVGIALARWSMVNSFSFYEYLERNDMASDAALERAFTGWATHRKKPAASESN